eukprot:COSAG01_NODE_87_length_27454_cov_201.243575_14_plen_867_part_00
MFAQPKISTHSGDDEAPKVDPKFDSVPDDWHPSIKALSARTSPAPEPEAPKHRQVTQQPKNGSPTKIGLSTETVISYDPLEGVTTCHQRLAVTIANNSWFQNIILLVIVTNCCWLGLTACTEGGDCDTDPVVVDVVEICFLVIYTAEFLVMVTAYPPVRKQVDTLMATTALVKALCQSDRFHQLIRQLDCVDLLQSMRNQAVVVGLRKYAPRVVVFVQIQQYVTTEGIKQLEQTILDVAAGAHAAMPPGARPNAVVCLNRFPPGEGARRDRALRRVEVPGFDVQDDTKRTSEYSYFKDSWNALDVLCLVTGYMQLLGPFKNMSAVRSFRVLRVLRTVNKIQTLKAIVLAVFKAGPMLASSGALLTMMVLLWGIAGVQFFGGELLNRCYDPVLQPNGPTASGAACGRRPCSQGQLCGRALQNSDSNLGGFDDIGSAVLTLIQCISLEGWVGYTKDLIDIINPLVFVYFIVVVLAISLFTMNLVLAVLKDSLHSAMESIRAKEDRVEQEKERLRRQNKEVEKRFRAISGQLMQLVKNGSIESACRSLIRKPAFDPVITWSIVANTVLLMFSYPNMPAWLSDTSDYLNLAFAALFAAEMFVKIQALGMKMYVRSGINLFDGLVVVLTIWSQVLLWVLDVSNHGSNSVRLLYLLRILRVFRLMSKIESLQVVLSNMKACIKPFSGMFILLALFMLIFSVLGVQLFGGKGDPDSRANFDTLYNASLSVFQICTREDWNQVMFSTIAAGKAQGDSAIWAILYFVVCLVVGSYIIMDLMLAILLEKFQSEFNRRREEKRNRNANVDTHAKPKMPELRSLRDLSDMELLDPRYLTRELLVSFAFRLNVALQCVYILCCARLCSIYTTTSQKDWR